MDATSTNPDHERVEDNSSPMSWPAVAAWAIFWLAVVAIVYILKAV